MAHGGGQILMKTNKWCWRKGEKQENKNEIKKQNNQRETGWRDDRQKRQITTGVPDEETQNNASGLKLWNKKTFQK